MHLTLKKHAPVETCFCACSRALAAAPISAAPPYHRRGVSKFQLNFSSAFCWVRVPELAPFRSNQFLSRRKASRMLLETYQLFLEENCLLWSVLLEILTILVQLSLPALVDLLGTKFQPPTCIICLELWERSLENRSVPWRFAIAALWFLSRCSCDGSRSSVWQPRFTKRSSLLFHAVELGGMWRWELGQRDPSSDLCENSSLGRRQQKGLGVPVDMSLFASRLARGFPLVKVWHSLAGWLEC